MYLLDIYLKKKKIEIHNQEKNYMKYNARTSKPASLYQQCESRKQSYSHVARQSLLGKLFREVAVRAFVFYD